MLYKTGVEYGDYTMNHVQGCSHGCTYPCYAYLMAKRFGRVKTYQEWCEPLLVENTLELLDKEIPKLRTKIETVQLCFTTDPFMYGYDEVEEMSLAAIGKLNQAGIPCVALTKGVLPAELAQMGGSNSYGISLVSLDEGFRLAKEPGAAPYASRIDALRALHDKGCPTWVSMEPYPTPNMVKQDLVEVLESVSFVDRIIFGRTNYNREASSFPGVKEYYNKCAEEVASYCEGHGISLHVKRGTWTEASPAVA